MTRRIPTLPFAGRHAVPLQRRACKGTVKGGVPCYATFTGLDGWCPAHRPRITGG